jgi:hypothetical protein
MLRALEQIRRMRGGAQSHLMRCDDGYYYVVKFQNNPQHTRVLVNELLGTRLAERLGLPTVPVEIVAVDAELIRLTPELAMEMPRGRIPCRPGLQFGSRYPGDPRELALHDFLPDSSCVRWRTCTILPGCWFSTSGLATPMAGRRFFFSDQGKAAEQAVTRYKTKMIDQGFCFNPGEWNFPDAPLRGLYARNGVYRGVTGMESFAPWLERLEKQASERVLDEAIREIPPEWYADDYDALMRLLEQLRTRRQRVPDMILEAKRSNRHPFPNWM